MYRVLNAAQSIAETGKYVASRLPGYPLYEYLIALTSAKNNVALANGLTALFSGLAILFIALILRRLCVPQYRLVALATAFVPLVYVNSTVTMDYLPAMAFQLAAVYCVLTHRPKVAGFFLGLAVGIRLTSILMWVPMAYWLWVDRKKSDWFSRIVWFSSMTMAIGIVAYFPVWLQYRWDFLTVYNITPHPSLKVLI